MLSYIEIKIFKFNNDAPKIIYEEFKKCLP